MILKKTISIITLLIISNLVFAQFESGIHKYYDHFKPGYDTSQYYSVDAGINNEIEFIAIGMFLTYKKFISSQDVNACVFYPSCSVYAIQSIQKKGMFVGLLNSLDRLTRCHHFADKYYSVHKTSGLLSDPVAP
jgi:uncharacterized protein